MPKSFEGARRQLSLTTKKSLNRELQVLITLVCEAIAEFRRYDRTRIAVSIGRSRSQGRGGTWAYVVPLRYVGGNAYRRGRRGGHSGYYQYKSDGIEKAQPGALYLMTFLFPRFFRLSPEERLETIVHELYHLHPTLRGDLRRFPKPHIHHGPTPAAYDQKVRELTAEALAHTPELARHPLIQGSDGEFESHRRSRLPIPRRIFSPGPLPSSDRPSVRDLQASREQPNDRPNDRPNNRPNNRPEQLWLFALMAILLSVGVFFGIVRSSHAAVNAVARRSVLLFSKPSAASEKLSRFPRGQHFEVLRLSHNRKWALVSGGGKKGWTPANWLKIQSAAEAKKENETALKEGIGDDDIANMNDDPEADIGNDQNFVAGGEASARSQVKDPKLAAFDKKAEKFIAKKKGKLFDKPTKFASRFGAIEKGDELELIRRSPKGLWARVRLHITGEEGWYPMPWIDVQRPARLDRSGNTALSLYGAYGNRGLSFGFGGGLAINVFSNGLEGRPRDRFEIGVDAAKWFGESFAQNNVTFRSKFFTGALFGRYIASSDSGFSAFGGEAGLSYTHVSLQSTGADPNVLATLGIHDGDVQVGLLLGAVGYLALSPQFFVEGGARIQLSSRTSVTSRVGFDLRF
jgi:hypothetical protein